MENYMENPIADYMLRQKVGSEHRLRIDEGDLSPTERQAVSAVVVRHTTKRPKCLARRFSAKAVKLFPTKDNTDMLPPKLLLAAVDHDEVVEQV